MDRKKIIAKEFLFFIATCTLTILTLVSMYAYNKISDFRISNIESKIIPEKVKEQNSLYKKIDKIDSLASTNNAIYRDYKEYKIQWMELNSELRKKNAEEDQVEYEKDKFREFYFKKNPILIAVMKNKGLDQMHLDIIINIMIEINENVNNVEFFINDFKKKYGIHKNSPTVNEMLKILEINKEISRYEFKIEQIKKNNFQITPFKNLISLSIKIFSVFFLILFVLRYLIIGIKWSLKTLKD